MPQDGSNNYQYPPGTRGVPDQTIESEAYNTFLDDLVVNDLNIARPIHRGGTGATTANAAIFNLGGERAAAVVTNYDSHVWMPGSFYSAAGATGAPVPGRAFVGIAYSSDPPAEPPANLNVIIEARDQNDTTVPGRVHIREKKAGVWGVWKGEDRLGIQTMPPSTVNSPDGALWWDNDNGVLYVNYNDGNTTQWVQAVALPQIDIGAFVAKAGDTMTGRLTLSDDPLNDLHAVPKRYVDGGVGGVSSGKVSKSGDTMTGFLTLHADPDTALKAATKQYVDTYAAPLDAMAYSGMQINGSMEVCQERPFTAAIPVTNTYVAEGWRVIKTGSMVVLANPGLTGGSLVGFAHGLFMTVTTAQPSLGASDQSIIIQHVEGRRAARLCWGTASAKPLTIAFWTWHNRIGLYSVSVRNEAGNRSYVSTYTQAVSDIPQYNVVTIPGCVDGVWETGELTGLYVTFSNGVGATFTTSSINTWLAGNVYSATGQVNGVAATSDVFRITGVVVLPGMVAPTAVQSPLIMRQFGEEIQICKRYYESSYPHNNPMAANMSGTLGGSSSAASGFIYTPKFIIKRAVPTVTVFSPSSGISGSVYDAAVGDKTATVDVVSAEGFRMYANVAVTPSSTIYFQYTANARL